MKPIQYLEISFDLPLTLPDIYSFRGAIARFAGLENDLFHNHDGDKLHYRYPLIQYRVKDEKAAILAFEQGVASVRKILLRPGEDFTLKGKKRTLRIIRLQEQEFPLKMLDTMQTYQIVNWIPFNTNNFKRWTDAATLIEKVTLLNGILVGHLLSFATGMDWQLPHRLEAELTNWSQTRYPKVHGTTRMALDISFSTNLSFPSGIGLGKATSQGFGVTTLSKA